MNSECFVEVYRPDFVQKVVVNLVDRSYVTAEILLGYLLAGSGLIDCAATVELVMGGI